MPNDSFTLYNDLASRVWDQMVNLVGVHATTVLVQRALWLTRNKYEEADSILIRDDGIAFERVSQDIDSTHCKEMAEEFFASLIGILTRLVGMEIVESLNEDVDRLLKSGALS